MKHSCNHVATRTMEIYRNGKFQQEKLVETSSYHESNSDTAGKGIWLITTGSSEATSVCVLLDEVHIPKCSGESVPLPIFEMPSSLCSVLQRCWYCLVSRTEGNGKGRGHHLRPQSEIEDSAGCRLGILFVLGHLAGVFWSPDRVQHSNVICAFKRPWLRTFTEPPIIFSVYCLSIMEIFVL